MMKKIIFSGLLILFNSIALADVGSLTAIPGHNKIILNWINNDGDTITLTRRVNNYPGTITDGRIYTGTGTSYIDGSVTNGIPYYYTAFDSAGSFSCAFTTPKQDTSPPDAPGTVTEGIPDEDFNDTGKYTIRWESAKDEQSNVVMYGVQERVGTDGLWGTIGSTAKLYWDVSGKTAGKVYYYRVCAQNEAGLWGTYSIPSDGIRVVDEKVELPNDGNYIYYTNASRDMVIIDIPETAFVGSVTFTISEIPPPINFASSTPQINATLTPCYELLAFGTDTKEVQPAATLTLIFSYNPHPLGTDTDYRVYRLRDNLWQALGSWTLIPEEDLIMVTVGSLSTYVVGWPVISLSPLGSFTATAGNNREITLGWQFPADNRVTEVIVVRKLGSCATTLSEGTQIYRGTATTHTETLLTPNTTYYYTAWASDGGANYSTPVFAQATATDTTPPGLVGSFTVKGEFKKITLSWTNPADTDFVKTVIVKDTSHFPQMPDDGTPIYQGAGTSTTDMDVLVEQQVYYYTAFSYDGINYSQATASVQGSGTPTFDDTPPSAPGTITEGSPDEDINSTGAYTLYWGTATDSESPVTRYFVQERIGIDGTWSTIGTTTHQLYGGVSGKTAGKVYYYRVQAQNAAGLWGTWSAVSDGIRVVNKAVTLPTVGSVGYNQMKVDIPGNAFIGSVTFTISEISPPANFGSSNPPMSQFLSSCYELLAFDSNTMQEVQPTKTLTMMFSYSPLTAGTESDYRIYRFGSESWGLAPGSQTIFPIENVIKVAINSLSTYVVGYPKATLTNVGSFTATPGNNREMTLTWTLPQDNRVTEVIIVRKVGSYATTLSEGTQTYRGTATTHTETLLTPDTAYYYTTFSSDGGINYSEGTFTQATATDTTPPGLVGSFTVKAEFKKAVLSWANPEDKDFAWVEIIRGLDHFPQTPKDGMRIYNDKGTATTDEGLALNQTYYYTAFSCDGINYSLATKTVQGSITSTKDISPPLAIGTITEGYWIMDIDRDVSSTGNYWVCWSLGTDTESGIINYELQEKKNSDNWKTVADNITVNYYLVTAKELGNTYYYQVRAKNGAGLWGSWSTTSDGIRIVSEYFEVSEPISFTVGSETIEIDAPIDAFEGTTTFTITNVSLSPATYFGQATPKIKKAISLNYQLAVINTNNIEQIPTTTLTIFITYSDTGLSPEDKEKLRIYQLNKATNQLEMLPCTLSENLIYATVTTLTTFMVALPSSPASTPMGVRVYPNPFKPSKGHDRITFEGLTNEVKIRIYKLTGELVYENDYSSTDGYEYWNATNSHGEDLASGVYIYVIEGGGEKAIGKIAIIR